MRRSTHLSGYGVGRGSGFGRILGVGVGRGVVVGVEVGLDVALTVAVGVVVGVNVGVEAAVGLGVGVVMHWVILIVSSLQPVPPLLLSVAIRHRRTMFWPAAAAGRLSVVLMNPPE